MRQCDIHFFKLRQKVRYCAYLSCFYRLGHWHVISWGFFQKTESMTLAVILNKKLPISGQENIWYLKRKIKQLLSDFIPKIPFLQWCLPYLLFVLAPLYHQLLGFPLVLEHPVKKKNTILLRLLYSKSNHELKRNKCCGPNSSHKKKRYWQVCIYAVQWWNNKW